MTMMSTCILIIRTWPPLSLDNLCSIINNNPGTSSEYFSILNINCRSLFNKFGELSFITKRLNNFFTLITLTETWLDDIKCQHVNLDNYNFIYKNRTL